MISRLIEFSDKHNKDKKHLEFYLMHDSKKVLINILENLEDICSNIEDTSFYHYFEDRNEEDEDEEYILYFSFYYDNMTDDEALLFIKAL